MSRHDEPLRAPGVPRGNASGPRAPEPARGYVRPTALGTLERSNGLSISLAMLECAGQEPALSIRFLKNGRPIATQLYSGADLDALATACAAVRAARGA